jgi:hypothetical protein
MVKAVLEIISPLGYTGDKDLGQEEVFTYTSYIVEFLK